ncbi:uncharacterized protein LOC113346871 [Papaver somniferum]|uniref:uncharacterized protein LOC113346871 n=1 Tax=Papaver somniferum TaxID=3469 RepID=UPI000E6F72F9|nr:uncharacterized protein LOC113346871 [Papaver somniferum]
MGGKKAPGPDGFTSLFYKKSWDTVEEVVIDMTQTCFRTGHLTKVFNTTNIALIPTVPLAELVSQYRPIILCNFIYKILSKTLSNRLKPLMDNIISQNQSAFVPKRCISDNILIANEVVYVVNHHKKKKGIVVIKLDMSKAYDKLEWSFLSKVLLKMALSAYIDNLTSKGLVEGIKEINFDKFGILFSKKLHAPLMNHLSNILDIHNKDLGEKYLVTPISFQASKIQAHMGILQAVDGRITSWLHRLLSQAARTTLVKHGEMLDSKDRKLHLLGWDALCSSRSEGGLGFRKYEFNNLVMLDRNAWKIIENHDCLLGSVLKARYFPMTDFLNAACPADCSWTWRGLHTIKEMIKPFISLIVGDCKFIDPWCDKWIPTLGSVTPNPLVPPDPCVKVSYLIDDATRSCNLEKLITHFDDASVQKIITIPLSQLCTPDRRDWELSKNGSFSSKSAYLGLRGSGRSPSNKLWKCIWKINVPHHIQLFTWKAARNVLPAKIVLQTRMPLHSVTCYVMRDFSSNASFCASIVFDVESAEEAEARAI